MQPSGSQLNALVIHSQPLVAVLAWGPHVAIVMRSPVTNDAFEKIDGIFYLRVKGKDFRERDGGRD